MKNMYGNPVVNLYNNVKKMFTIAIIELCLILLGIILAVFFGFFALTLIFVAIIFIVVFVLAICNLCFAIKSLVLVDEYEKYLSQANGGVNSNVKIFMIVSIFIPFVWIVVYYLVKGEYVKLSPEERNSSTPLKNSSNVSNNNTSVQLTNNNQKPNNSGNLSEKDRLLNLKKMYENNLLSKEEYESKRKKIIDSI